MRKFLHNECLHIGWAIWGTGCDCGNNRWNWLADFMKWADPDTEENYWIEIEDYKFPRKQIFWTGQWFYDLGMKLDTDE